MRRALSALLAAAGGLGLAPAQAQQAGPPPDAAPDLEFLEYLGSWQADDEEWLAIREWEKDNPPADVDDADQNDDGEQAPERSRDDNDDSK
jgi:hypothetical protein